MNRVETMLFSFSRRDEGALVHDPHRARQILLRAVGLFAVVLGAVVAVVPSGWWGALVGALLGAAGARAAFVTVRRAQSYRSGWLDGRRDMLASLVEAQRRGMTQEEWAIAMLEKDWETMR